MSILNKKSKELNQGQPQILVKVVIIGDSGVGKTSLMTRQNDDWFDKQYQATIGVDFRIKIYDLGHLKLKAQLWDTAGAQRFRSLQTAFYRNSKAVCLCFSLADKRSFENLNRYIQELDKYKISRDMIFLIGCKSDLDAEVAMDEILKFVKQNGISYHQTSSKTGGGVHEAFHCIMISLAQKQILLQAQSENKQMKGKNLNQKSVSQNSKWNLC